MASKRQRLRSSRSLRERRHLRLRNRVIGSPERPRLSVYRSLSNIYAQVIDDARGVTMAAASTIDPSLREELGALNKTEAAKRVGRLIAERAQQAGVSRVVFDRGGNKYHGRVKALAEAAREGGLEF